MRVSESRRLDYGPHAQSAIEPARRSGRGRTAARMSSLICWPSPFWR